jgi:S1-C subfamily serine protease
VATADWIVIGVVVLFGFYGLSRGLVRGALSLAGFALGAYLGAQIAPAFLSDGSPYAPLVALGAAILGGVLLQTFAGILGGTLRAGMSAVPGLRSVDSAAGALLGVLAGVLICWAVGAVLLYLPGQSELRRSVQESAILSRINEDFPPERLLETLERVDPIGVVVGPPAIVPPPDSAIARDPDVDRASGSVVRVTGVACGLGVEGSGWIVRRGMVVTNAHVVAGISKPLVDRRGGRSLSASVVAFDVANDLAVLRVRGLRGAPLPMADPERKVPVALIGYPGNGPLTVIPGRLGGTGRALSRDAYGRGPVTRNVTAIRGEVRPGLSGGPAVDGEGRVRTVVFARRPDDVGGYGVPSATVRDVLEKVGGEALSTECAR